MSFRLYNFIICGHGSLILNDNSYVDEFNVPTLSVITFAPPTAGCMYPPENLPLLRNNLHSFNNQMTDFNEFHKVIIREEKKIFGFNYCDDVWIGYYGKEQQYDPSKGCGIQIGTVQDKLFSFVDDAMPDGVLGIWELSTNQNIMDTIPVEPVMINGNPFYRFSDIMKFLELAFGSDSPINVLDCTCSVVYNHNYDRITDSRTQRRFQRGIINKKTGGKITKNKKYKKYKKYKNTKSVKMQKKYTRKNK
jgi:hypothetical protein